MPRCFSDMCCPAYGDSSAHTPLLMDEVPPRQVLSYIRTLIEIALLDVSLDPLIGPWSSQPCRAGNLRAAHHAICKPSRVDELSCCVFLQAACCR